MKKSAFDSDAQDLQCIVFQADYESGRFKKDLNSEQIMKHGSEKIRQDSYQKKAALVPQDLEENSEDQISEKDDTNDKNKRKKL